MKEPRRPKTEPRFFASWPPATVAEVLEHRHLGATLEQIAARTDVCSSTAWNMIHAALASRASTRIDGLEQMVQRTYQVSEWVPFVAAWPHYQIASTVREAFPGSDIDDQADAYLNGPNPFGWVIAERRAVDEAHRDRGPDTAQAEAVREAVNRTYKADRAALAALIERHDSTAALIARHPDPVAAMIRKTTP